LFLESEGLRDPVAQAFRPGRPIEDDEDEISTLAEVYYSVILLCFQRIL
jgi:hypothetical protein